MLDTVLNIGKALRNPDNREKALSHHRYVERCPLEEENEVLRLRIPVSNDFKINIDGLERIQNERLYEKLFFLKYKSADADTFVKYIFGDIFFSQERGGLRAPHPGIIDLEIQKVGIQHLKKVHSIEEKKMQNK